MLLTPSIFVNKYAIFPAATLYCAPAFSAVAGIAVSPIVASSSVTNISPSVVSILVPAGMFVPSTPVTVIDTAAFVPALRLIPYSAARNSRYSPSLVCSRNVCIA